MNLNENGRKWARNFLLIALFVSVVGNVTHTVLADSTISLWLRVPNAVIWPVFTWGAIEIVVRIVWESKWSHRLARTAVLFPAVPAAITSYEHLYNLQGMMGERPMIQWIAPAAIDGLMIGCTLTLLFTREIVEQIAPVVKEVLPPESLSLALASTLREEMDAHYVPVEANNENVKPVSPAPPRAPRAPRVAWDAYKVIDMLLEGSEKVEIQAATGIKDASFYRYKKVVRALRADRSAAIDAATEKVRPEHVDYIRKALAR